MKKILKLIVILLGIFAGSLAVYWFNLDNKLIYYVVRPLLNKIYNSQNRDVKI